jgi:acyl carrier protein
MGARFFTHALTQKLTQVAALRIDWPSWTARCPRADVATLLSALGPTEDRPAISGRSAPVGEGSGADATVIQRLRRAPIDRRLELVEEFVQSQVGLVLGHSAHAVSRTRGLAEMGLDSLASIELRARLEKAFACRLPTTLVFDHPTVATLAAHVLEDVLSIALDERTATSDVLLPGEGDLESLSRDDIAALLASELGMPEENHP